MAMMRKTSGKALTKAPRPRAAAPNQTRVAVFMPTTLTRAEACPFSTPDATAKRFAGPGVMAITTMTPRKVTYRCGSTGRADMGAVSGAASPASSSPRAKARDYGFWTAGLALAARSSA